MKMTTIVTHSLAVVIGALTVYLLRPAYDDSKNSSGETQASARVKRGTAGSATPPPAGPDSRNDLRQLVAGRSRKITDADVEQWLAGKKGDSRSLAEAQAIAGLLTEKPDLIRQALKADPENPLLLYIGGCQPTRPGRIHGHASQ